MLRGFVAGLWTVCAFAADGAPQQLNAIVIPVGQHQLFLDDYVAQEMSGLTPVMHRPQKRGAVLKPDIPSDGDLVQIRAEPIRVETDSLYKILYFAYGKDPKQTVGMALATSADLEHWQKPVLGEVEVNGSTRNNWILPETGVSWPDTQIEGVVYDAKDPDPARRYKALRGGINRVPVASLDGIHWKRVGTEVIPSSDESHFIYDEIQHQYLAIVKGSNQFGRAFNLATSKDFEHWSPPRPFFGADAIDQKMAPEVISRRLNNPAMLGPFFKEPQPTVASAPHQGGPIWRAEVYNIAVFPYEGIYIGFPSLYYPTGTSLPERNNTDGFHVIQLAMSRDLTTWQRIGDRQPFIDGSGIDKGRVGVFDRTQLLATSAVRRGNELWFFYSGLKWRDAIYTLNPDGTPRDPATLTDVERADLKDGWGAGCVAVLRRDGFVSLDAKETAFMLTKPFVIEGKRIFVNASAKDGEVAVEILDPGGKPVSGFSRSDAVPTTADEVSCSASWKGGSDISTLAKREIRLKFYVKNASLYSFWIE